MSSFRSDDFKLLHKRQKAAVASLTPEQLDEMRAVFALFDVNGDGTLDATELGNALRVLGNEANEKEISDLIRQLMLDGSSKLEFNDFVYFIAMRMNLCDSETDIWEALKIFDPQCSGYLPFEKFKFIMTEIGTPVTMEEFDLLMDEIGKRVSLQLPIDRIPCSAIVSTLMNIECTKTKYGKMFSKSLKD